MVKPNLSGGRRTKGSAAVLLSMMVMIFLGAIVGSLHSQAVLQIKHVGSLSRRQENFYATEVAALAALVQDQLLLIKEDNGVVFKFTNRRKPSPHSGYRASLRTHSLEVTQEFDVGAQFMQGVKASALMACLPSKHELKCSATSTR